MRIASVQAAHTAADFIPVVNALCPSLYHTTQAGCHDSSAEEFRLLPEPRLLVHIELEQLDLWRSELSAISAHCFVLITSEAGPK